MRVRKLRCNKHAEIFVIDYTFSFATEIYLFDSILLINGFIEDWIKSWIQTFSNFL